MKLITNLKKYKYNTLQYIWMHLPKLSYEPFTHKKVYDVDAVVWIPEGSKYVLWFGDDGRGSLMTMGGVLEAVWFSSYPPDLRNVMLVGTMLQKQKRPFLAVERVYMGQKKQSLSYLSQILPRIPRHERYIVGLPLITRDIENYKPPYRVQCFEIHRSDESLVYAPFLQKKRDVFCVRPDIQNDIYHLFQSNRFVDVACIPDYKTSVMMNRVFRRIKENDNLDSLEESDDESEFEDCRVDKYVFLDKSVPMVCEWHPRFKKWMPVSLEEKNSVDNIYIV
jgi:hypothetical protein